MVSYIILIFSILSACAPTLQGEIDTSLADASTPVEEIVIGVQANDSCGHAVGDKVCDLILKDQNDELWRLYDLEGNVIVLDFSAMWCAPCQNAASTVQQTQDDYESEGFNYITVLIDDPAADTVELDEVQAWADSHGIETTSVLQGSRDLIDQTAIEGYPIVSWPTFVFIDRDLNVHWGIYGFNEEYIRTQIEEML
tara:strand:- start:1850 stop:2440 length:591 start_codon:yes stop_codon:yes gene_type:complete